MLPDVSSYPMKKTIGWKAHGEMNFNDGSSELMCKLAQQAWTILRGQENIEIYGKIGRTSTEISSIQNIVKLHSYHL